MGYSDEKVWPLVKLPPLFGESPFCIAKTDRKEYRKPASVHESLVPKLLSSASHKTLNTFKMRDKYLILYE